MYTTNAIESVNSSFREVTKRGSFPNENSLFKLLYLRILELYKKWADRPCFELEYGKESTFNKFWNSV